jgi:diketogulonate reductase-like aldo/keto reductase
MEFKQLGNTGVMAPEIGLGTWNFSGGIVPLRKGVELGASLIDTAEGYYTEDIVGKAIKGIRKGILIATKVSGRHLGYDDVLRAAERSLRLLGTDYIDLYQIHWPNSLFPVKETLRAMEELSDSGVVKYIGVSNFSIEELKEAQSFMRNYPIVSNQVLYNLNNREIERNLLPYCQKHRVTIIAYTPLDSGRLAKKSRQMSGRGVEVLGQIANELQKTMSQVALNWCISKQNVIAIPKSNNVERTIENCLASGWKLSRPQIELLDDAFS